MMVLISCCRFSASTIQNVSNLPDVQHHDNEFFIRKNANKTTRNNYYCFAIANDQKIVIMVGGKSPIDDFKCHLVVDIDEVIRRCRKLNNLHILFNDGMAKYFLLGKDEARKQLLQDAADKG
uniref:Uncharacterized protein n=1 Tax=Lactuca sativa TaxID=4236 RepID=A0A9R1WAW9_LACSA|nr:hypothetical protein LSAT_V11C200074060 [Lactuca sativa]